MGPVAAGAVPGEHLALPNINSASRASIPPAPPGQHSAGTTAWLVAMGTPPLWAAPHYGSLQRHVGTLCQVCPFPGAKPLVQVDDADPVSSTVPMGILQHLVLGEDVTPTPTIAGCPSLGLPWVLQRVSVGGSSAAAAGAGECWEDGGGGSCLQWVLPVGCWWGGQGRARPSPSPAPRRAAQPCSSGSFSASVRPGASTLGK